jgi:hypothetical protein
MKLDLNPADEFPVAFLVLLMGMAYFVYHSLREIPPAPLPKEPEVHYVIPPPGHWSINTGECDPKQPAHVEVETPWGQKIHMYCSKGAK